MSEALQLRREGELAWLVMNRPDRRNALTFEMWHQLPDVLADVEQDVGIKVLAVRGVDRRAFSAGADIGEFTTLRSTRDGAMRYNDTVAAGEEALSSLSKPTIAMIQGPAIGGGCGLATSCDLRIADPTARFGITPAKIGLVYGLPSTKRLVDLVGPSRAKHILYSGELMDAERAFTLGLVDEIVPADEVEGRVRDLALTIASRAQFSVRATKRIIDLILAGATEDDDETRALRLDSFTTDDYREGVQAFLEKRAPRFTYS